MCPLPFQDAPVLCLEEGAVPAREGWWASVQRRALSPGSVWGFGFQGVAVPAPLELPARQGPFCLAHPKVSASRALGSTPADASSPVCSQSPLVPPGDRALQAWPPRAMAIRGPELHGSPRGRPHHHPLVREGGGWRAAWGPGFSLHLGRHCGSSWALLTLPFPQQGSKEWQRPAQQEGSPNPPSG